MKIKAVFCFLLIGLLLCRGIVYNAFASDIEEETVISETGYEFFSNWKDLKAYVAENDIPVEYAVIVNALYLQHQEILDISRGIGNIVAFLFLLVGFEMMRVVRSWSKGVGIK